jgi:hypothetical protein
MLRERPVAREHFDTDLGRLRRRSRQAAKRDCRTRLQVCLAIGAAFHVPAAEPNLEGADQGTLSPHELSIFATQNHVETKLFNKNSQLYPAAWGVRFLVDVSESALYAPFMRTKAEFKERIKADDTDATRWLSPTVIARGRKMWTRARVGHSRAALSGSCHKCRTFEKQLSIKPLRTSKRHESNRQRRCCVFVRARGA